MNKIHRYLLKKIGEKSITEYLIERSRPADTQADDKTWSEAFWRIPLLKDWLKKRELHILKGLPFNKESPEFVRGQLFENLLYQHFDAPRPDLGQVGPRKVAAEEEIIDRTTFLKKWSKENAQKETTPGEQKDARQEGEKSS